ncbi:hypothetical protein F5Y16DRAFT_82320 [Xylariaceae sp. FL0255]|nr:hypothetical protein F5Y16DRAFT_82320 [Xylariaceae sp. FL0255]
MTPKFVQNPTYLLAPNWTFVPDGPIALGNLIADPFRPHIALKKAPIQDDGTTDNTTTTALLPPAIQRVSEEKWRLHLGTKLNLSTSLWANFTQLISAKVSGKHAKHTSITYSTRELETVYYTELPSAAFINSLTKDPVVHDLMRLDNPFSRPVYMITGLKIAKGFALEAQTSRENGGEVGASGPVGGPVPVSVGAEIGISVGNDEKGSFKSGTDIIFAYQLVRLAAKGWKEKALSVSEYAPSAAFLSDNSGGGGNGGMGKEESMEIEWDFLEMEDLEDPGTDFSTSTVQNGQEEITCIAFEEDEY